MQIVAIIILLQDIVQTVSLYMVEWANKFDWFGWYYFTFDSSVGIYRLRCGDAYSSHPSKYYSTYFIQSVLAVVPNGCQKLKSMWPISIQIFFYLEFH